MKTAAEYRAMAQECFKWAGEAQAEEVRVSLRQLAQVWLDAASKLDGLATPAGVSETQLALSSTSASSNQPCSAA